MAVPGHDATGLNGQFPEAQLAILDIGRLFFQVDRAERDVGDADRLEVDLLAHIGLHLVGRAFAGEGRSRSEDARDRQGREQRMRSFAGLEHVMISFGRLGRWPRPRLIWPATAAISLRWLQEGNAW